MANLIEVKVPDIGDFDSVPIIEIHVKAGDTVVAEQSLITLESDKASMDVPSSANGVIKELKVKIGDKVSKGHTILVLEESAGASVAPAPKASPAPTAPAPAPAPVATSPALPKPAPAPVESHGEVSSTVSHASPSVRKFARDLGVDVSKVKGSGPKGRITQEDVQNYVKGIMTGQASAPSGGGAGLNLLPWPKIDFTKFGEIERQPLSRIKKISAANLSRNWVVIPAVTYHEDADITDLETFRVPPISKMRKRVSKSPCWLL
jgi:pyruvate dehydrogenase E2 component (dihydrolipoamide acetyltransferase)